MLISSGSVLNMDTYEYYKSILKDESYPLAFIDMDLLDKNIESILQRNQSGKSIRIASKSIRSTDIIHYVLKSDPAFQGIMSYSGTEAVHLSKQGFDDILIAYPIVDTKIIEEVIAEINQGKTIYFMVDSVKHLNILQRLGEKHDCEVPVCIDIDLSHSFFGIYFGVYRSSIRSMRVLRGLVTIAKEMSCIQIRGVMGYEAQIAGVPDSSPSRNFLLNFIVRRLKSRSIPKLRHFREEVVEYIKSEGIELDFVNGGGTGSVESTTMEDVVTEVTVGSGFFSPVLFDYYNNFQHLPATGYGIQVTRNPKPGVYTCHGGGYIASGAIGVDKQPKPYLPKDAKLFPDEGAGEVQTPIKTKYELNIGDPVFFRHAKAGELCEHFNNLIMIRDGQIVKKIPTYRGQGNTFL